MTDRKVLHRITISSLAVLLLALILPSAVSGRILAAILLLPLAIVTYLFVKKRSILSMNKKQILMLMAVIGLLYLMLYYLSGLHFGFYRSGYRFDFYYGLHFVLPISAIIIETEFIRWIVRAQNNKAADVLTYFSCVIAEVLIVSNISGITTYSHFMDVLALALLPAVTANFLYHYLSKRYGMLPNIVYRLLISLYTYIIPYKPAVPDSMLAFINLLLPIAIYLFIDALYEKKKRYALGKKSKFGVIITVLAVAIMASAVMLISNQFRYGVLVVATESMTGELNKGDAALFERFENQIITEGQVIVFEKNGSMIIHRVIKIEKINGVMRYYTKGDANDGRDSGFITNSDIVGLVNYRVPYIGYPTIWVRSLFKH
ncbi:MAG: signal peptidase I [Clostridia bacterium]|nr:signal peptidase I [Clostridia bacterium]